MLYLFLLIFGFSFSAHAEIENCAPGYSAVTKNHKKEKKSLFEAQAEAFRDWMRANQSATKAVLAKKIKKHIAEASAHLKKLGIRHSVEKSSKGTSRIVITPGAKSLFNRYARGLLKYDPKNKAIYDPYQLHRQYTTAYFQNSEGVFVSLESLVKGTPREEDVVHETIHAYHDYLERIGKASILHGSVSPAKRNPKFRTYRVPGPIKGGYANYLSMDELITYQSSLRDTGESYAAALLKGDTEEIADAKKLYDQALRTFGNIQERAREVMRHTKAALQKHDSIFLNADKNPIVKFELDGKKFEAQVVASTFASSVGSVKPFSEYAELSVRELPSTVQKGERPLGFVLDLNLRSSMGETNSRNILPEAHRQIEALNDHLTKATDQRNQVIQAMDELVKSVQTKASKEKLEILHRKLKEVSGLQR